MDFGHPTVDVDGYSASNLFQCLCKVVLIDAGRKEDFIFIW